MNRNLNAGVGAGRGRRPFLIREFLDAQGSNMSKIADALGVSRQVVQATVRGHGNNRRVLQKLRDMGCPEEHLSLPEDMRE